MAVHRPRHSGSGARANRAGFVYLIALLAVTVASAIAMVMGRGVGLRLQAGNAITARADCRAAALGMVRAIVNDLNASLALGMPQLSTVQPAGEQIGDCTVILIGRDPHGVTMPFGLIPEAGKFPINAPASGAALEAEFNILSVLPGMTQDVAAAMLDWVDSDDDVSVYGGAERTDSAYAGAPVPYAPRNSQFEALAELRLVRGVTDALYFGEDVNGNGRLDPGEDSDRDGKLTPGLRDMISVMDIREPPNAPDGSPRLNLQGGRVNRTFQDLLTGLFGSARGNEIFALATGVFTNRLELFAALELSDAEAAALWPCVSVNNVRTGLIDAWSCRDEILIAIAGNDLAQKIIAARPTTPPTGPGWLTSLLTRDEAKLYGNQLGSGSYQFSADILAVRNDGSGWARLGATFKCELGTAAVGGLQPLETQGWPLPWVTPDQLRGTDPSAVATLLTAVPH